MPLSHLDRMDLLKQFGLTPEGRDYVSATVASSPFRLVTSTGSNQLTYYQSKKMDRELGFESHTVEYRAGLLLEYNPKVLEYYAQPKSVEFRAVGPITGKVFRVQHTPDFLVISDHAVYIDEWKPEARLMKLAKRQPDRFIKDQGVWQSPLLEEHFRPMGINYRVRSGADIPRLRVANLEFLSGYMDRDCPKVETKSAIWLSNIQNGPRLSLSNPQEQAKPSGFLFKAMSTMPNTPIPVRN
jgi:putative transposase